MGRRKGSTLQAIKVWDFKGVRCGGRQSLKQVLSCGSLWNVGEETPFDRKRNLFLTIVSLLVFFHPNLEIEWFCITCLLSSSKQPKTHGLTYISFYSL